MREIALHILDLIENSVKAGANSVSVTLAVDENSDSIRIVVEDDGKGFSAPMNIVTDPFFTTSRTKQIGLGLSLFKATAEMVGGSLTIRNASDCGSGGAVVEVNMNLFHVNRPELGDLAQTISTMVCVHPEIDFRLTVKLNDSINTVSSRELASAHRNDNTGNIGLAVSVLRAIAPMQTALKRIESNPDVLTMNNFC